MTDTYPLALALLDFVPNLAFGAGAYFLWKMAQRAHLRAAALTVLAGGLLCFLAGTLKAIWKLLFTLNLADVQLLSNQQFVLHALGFPILLVGVARVLAQPARRVETRPVMGVGLPLMAAWKMPLLAVMLLSSISLNVLLAVASFRRRQGVGGALFIFATLALLAMGAFSSGEQTVARQWIEELTNTGGQAAFMAGAYLLYRAGVKV